MKSSLKLAFAVCALSALAVIRAIAQSNTPPQLPVQSDQMIVELTTLVITNTATDQDVPANELSYALLSPPAGASIDNNGVITWTPSEAQGPGIYTIKTVVADNGEPPLTAINSFLVTVTEVNSAPVLGFIPDQTVAVSSTLVVTNAATDADLPANTLSYALIGAPAGAAIDSNGVITWTPDHGPSTNTITTVVTDNGQPPLSATNSFKVVVTVPGTNEVFMTNLVMNLNISLTSYSQLIRGLSSNSVLRSVGISKIATKDIIAQIGTEIGNGTNIFPASASLVFAFIDVGTPNQQTAFFVRFGTTDTNVSHYLDLSTATSSSSVEQSRTNSNQGTITATEYLILEFKLQNVRSGGFDVQGFTTLPATTVVDKQHNIIGHGTFPTAFVAMVAGSGQVDSRTAVFRGTITAAGRKIEIRARPN